MTALPTWAVWALSFGIPILTFVGVLIAQVISPEKQSRRVEVMLHLRWATELAVSADGARSRLGVAQLELLSVSRLLNHEWEGFVDQALMCAIQPAQEEIEQAEEAGEDVRVFSTVPVELAGS